ncbi:MAG TPA: LanC-like protein [Gaiellaceae bacterium]
MLFEPEAHEAPSNEPWSAERVRTAIASIVADAESAFDDGWPTHPQDADNEDDARTRFRTVYLGGAGVVAALHRLAGRGLVELRRDYVPYLERSLEAQPDFPHQGAESSLWMGETGIRLVLQRLAPSQANLERLSELIAANERDERCEVMWGSPGTILAGRELGLDVTASVEWLQGRRDADGLWTQQLAGQSGRYLGPAHGFAGCVLALGDGAGVSETLRRFAVEEGGLVNWPPVTGMRLDENGDGQIRTQWCHGAPGIVATLTHILDEELAVAGGELAWRAGPLRKGANLCHGTAGNGYAFLALLEHTGDERWLMRARAFAMHAAGQVEHSRSDYGHGRYTLWTGDLGTALYLADCTDGRGGATPPIGRSSVEVVFSLVRRSS